MMMFDDGTQEPFWEGCLSFPDIFGSVKRYLKIDASWVEIEDGRLVRKREIFEGVKAIMFQHESEHLDGILFIDYLKKEGGEVIKMVGNKEVKWSVEKI